MPYPESHLYLTLHWTNKALPGEHGQTGVRFASPKAATQARVDACRAAVLAMWGAAGFVGTDYGLEFIRLARIGPNGLYSNASSFDHSLMLNGLAAAGTAAASAYPLQVACATTLQTATPHGDASKGRMYLPPIPAALPADLQWSEAQVNARSDKVAAFLASVGPVLGGPATVYSKGSTRNPGGISRKVTSVKTGRRPDVQRRRAKGIRETYGLPSNVADVPRDAGPAEDLGV